jgi:hypothetical protein
MAEDDKVDMLIREIASKHGISVGRDDPLMILQTINDQLIKEGSEAQEALLQSFKEELEGIAHKWNMDATSKAEKIIKAALAESKKTIVNSLAEDSEETVETIKLNFANILKKTNGELLKNYNKFTVIVMASALVSLVSAALTLAAFLLR